MKLVKIKICDETEKEKRQRIDIFWKSVNSLTQTYMKPVKIDNIWVDVRLDLKKRGDDVASFNISNKQRFTASQAPDIRSIVRQIVKNINDEIIRIEKETGFRVQPLNK